MVKYFLTVLITFQFLAAFGQIKPKGTFIGLERMKNYRDAKKPEYTWYHLSKLTFKGDSVFLEQSPVAIYKNDTSFSASDGGFYSYSGKIQNYKGKAVASLRLLSCDYCPMQMVRFTPPKIFDDYDTSTATDVETIAIPEEPKEIEIQKVKNKTMSIEKTKSSNTILVDRNIYRRKNK